PGTRLESIACSTGVLDERDAPWMKENAMSGHASRPPVHVNQASPRHESRPIAFSTSNIVRRSKRSAKTPAKGVMMSDGRKEANTTRPTVLEWWCRSNATQPHAVSAVMFATPDRIDAVHSGRKRLC